MGLDQYAYAEERDAVNEAGEPMEIKKEIMYWRKHPSLQGWMENLWDEKGRPVEAEECDESFNCIRLYLERDDIKQLKKDVIAGKLPPTQGFFFGDESDDDYKTEDIAFCNSAIEYMDDGYEVYYYSWW